MNREQLSRFMAAAPVRRDNPEFVRQKLVAALEGMGEDAVSMRALSEAAGVHIHTVWHRIKHKWRLKAVARTSGVRGGFVGLYERLRMLECLKGEKYG